jgi:hypothetical protein
VSILVVFQKMPTVVLGVFALALLHAVHIEAQVEPLRTQKISVPGSPQKPASSQDRASLQLKAAQEAAARTEPADKNAGRRDFAKDFQAPIVDPQNREGFFARNSAQTIFAPAAEVRVKPELQYFPALQPVEDQEQEKAVLAALHKSEADSKPKDLTSPEGIVEAFGAPGEDDQLLAEDKAPPSYKGMMAALEIGDEKLAWQYARRYARRVREMGSRSATIMGLTGKALEREGVLPKDGWQSAPQFNEQQKFLEEDLRESGALKAEESRIASLDPATRAFLKKAEEVEEMESGKASAAAAQGSGMGGEQAQQAAPQTEAEMRAALRQKFNGKVPVDPKGLVQIYYFFRPNDARSLAMAPQVEQFFRKASLIGGVSFTAMTLEAPNPVDVEVFRKKTGASFSIQSGSSFARQFDLKVTPTTLFIAGSTGQMAVETGPRSAIYLEELLAAMRGKPNE